MHLRQAVLGDQHKARHHAAAQALCSPVNQSITMTTAATLSLHVLNAIVQLLSHTSLHVLHVIKDDPQASAVLTDREQAQQQQ